MNQLERVARSICREVIGSYNLSNLVSVDTTNEDGRPLWQSYTKEAQAAIDAMDADYMQLRADDMRHADRTAREECAKICDKIAGNTYDHTAQYRRGAGHCSANIRETIK